MPDQITAAGEDDTIACPQYAIPDQQTEQRPIFVVVLSPASMDSVYVNREISMAMMQDPQRIRILPILYQPCSIRSDLKPIQYVSFAPPTSYNQGLEEMLGALGLER